MYAGPSALQLRDDESLYSLVGRCFVLSGRPSQCSFLAEITGGHRRALSLTLPCNLAGALSMLPLGRAISVEEAIDRFTLVPLVRPFISASDWDVIAPLMAGPAPQAARMRLGIVRIGQGWPQGLRHCGECAMAQMKAWGSPYWTMQFALPFVTACPAHGARLVPCEPACRFALTPTAPVGLPPASLLDSVAEGATTAQQRLSRLACDLHASGLAPLGQPQLVAAYRAGLREQGLLSRRGRIDVRGVQERLSMDWGELAQVHAMLAGAASFLHRLFTTRASPVRAPLPHLLAIGTLFGSIGSWRERLSIPSQRTAAQHMEPAHRQYAGTRDIALGAWRRDPQGNKGAIQAPSAMVALLQQGWPVKRVARRLKLNIKTVYRALHADDDLFGRWGAAGLQNEADQRSGRAVISTSDSVDALRRRTRNDQTWHERHRSALEGASSEYPARAGAAYNTIVRKGRGP